MEKLRVHQRWMALPWFGLCMPIALVLGGVFWYSEKMYPEEQPSVRLIVPMYLLYVYWVIALLCNKRTSTITPQGVRVIVWPLPVRFRRQVERENIRHCFIRRNDVADEETLLERNYSVGVETMVGKQIEISHPHDTEEEAIVVASQIAQVLNQGPGSRVEVLEVEQFPERAEVLSVLVLVGVWLALALGAIYLGVAWEQERLRQRAGAKMTEVFRTP